MNLACRHCNTKLSIPEHKIPKDKEATLKCPKCKGTIKISPNVPPTSQSEQSIQSSMEIENQPQKTIFEDRLNALVCVGNEDLKKKIYLTIKQMGIDSTVVLHAKSALNKIEYNIYHLVIIDDSFDQGKGAKNVIAHLNNIDMSLRRRMCLVKISEDINTNDNMTALHTNVNAIIHLNDVIHIEAFLLKLLSEHKNVYTVYNESLKLAGKA